MGRGTAGLLIALLLVLASGCAAAPADHPDSRATPSASATTSSDPVQSCTRARRGLVRALRSYVASYDTATTRATARATVGPGRAGGVQGVLQQALKRTRATLAREHCDLARFRQRFRRAASRIRTRGPVARAVLLRLQAQLTEGSAPTGPVHPSARLDEVIARSPAGATVLLASGTFRLHRPLVLLAGVTIRGEGPGRTRIVSDAGDASIMVLTGGRVELDSLTVRHRGPRRASVIVGGPTSALVLTDVHVTGARRHGSGQTGTGILMTSAAGAGARAGGARTTLQVTGSTIRDNDAAGVLLTGRQRASIRRTRFADNRQCGACFLDRSSGAVRHSRFTDNAVGVVVLDRAEPLLEDDSFAGGQVAVQAGGHARPVVRRTRVDGAGRAALIFGARSSGRVERTTCAAVPYGIVISPQAFPMLGENSCALAHGAASPG